MWLLMHLCPPFWPVHPPVLRLGAFGAILAIAGIIFTVIMLVDCLKRNPQDFAYPLTEKGQHDKLIWLAAIVFSLSLYFVGSIVYFFVVKKAKKQTEQKHPPQE